MPIALTAEYDAPCLGAAARSSKNAGQTRRLLALAAVYNGATQTDGCVYKFWPSCADEFWPTFRV